MVEKSKPNDEKSAQQRLTEGSTWMTVASVLSRVLGVIYIIPWWRWMGDAATANEANALFNVGYNWYSIFLMIAVAGVPQAISRQLAHYNAKQEYRNAQRLFKAAIWLMIATGLVTGVALYLLAPLLAIGTPTRETSDGIATIRSLAPALIVLPFLSISRGFFEGHQDMKPSAISQITEQLARVGFMLASVYILRRILDAPVRQAVVQSTFAAFIGAVVAIATLAFYYFKHRTFYAHDMALSQETEEIKTGTLLKEIVMIAIPFILSGAIMEFLNVIDTQTFKPIMSRVTGFSEGMIINEYGIFSANVRKLVTVLISFATSISSTLVPIISSTFTREKENQRASAMRGGTRFPETNAIISHGLSLGALVLLPASLGTALIANNAYQLIYAPDSSGTYYLQLSAISAIVQGLYFLLISILQAMNLQKRGMLGIAIAVVTKLILQYPMIAVFHTPGAIYATLLAFLAPIIYYFYILKKYGEVDYTIIADSVWPIIKAVIVMVIVGIATAFASHWFIGSTGILANVISMLLVVIVSMIVYTYMTLKYQRLDILIGQPRADQWRQRLKIHVA
ncbi:MAG: polysaccharide biosynthesis protein [Aerococcus sp.]|nr:polysaccharide biosynthesis protein [Aerococcus sp.]